MRKGFKLISILSVSKMEGGILPFYPSYPGAEIWVSKCARSGFIRIGGPDKDACKIDPLAIVTKLFNTKESHFEDIQVILHIFGYSALKNTCESVLETFVSEYEYANDRWKNFHEENITDVFEICHNGPIISKCDRIVDMALKSYAKDKKKLHFVTAKTFSKSEVILRMEKESSGLVFMD